MLIDMAVLAEQAVSHNPLVKKRQVLATGPSGQLVNLSQARFPPGEMAPAHVHTGMTEVFMVQQGQGEIVIDDQVYPFTPGMVAVIEPGQRHEIRNPGGSELLLTYFGLIHAD
jgi:mannose-6-phosphate isomerase-like protein (cupin superfamily)